MSDGKSVRFSALIEGARGGDAECRDRLFALCRSYLGFAARSQVETWLRRILSHNLADFVRQYRGTSKRAARREVPFRDPALTAAFGAPEPAAPDQTPSQQFLDIDSELQLTEAMAQLPPDYQEVIVLRNLQRLSCNEVAERMERSRPAVQMLWMRAIKQLQQLLNTSTQ